jgi:hypothetical protein
MQVAGHPQPGYSNPVVPQPGYPQPGYPHGVLLLSRKSIGLILLNIAGAIALLISLHVLLGLFVPSAVFRWEPLLVRRALLSPWLGRLAAIPGAVVALALLIFANVRSTRLWVGATTSKPGPAYGQPPYPHG